MSIILNQPIKSAQFTPVGGDPSDLSLLNPLTSAGEPVQRVTHTDQGHVLAHCGRSDAEMYVRVRVCVCVCKGHMGL